MSVDATAPPMEARLPGPAILRSIEVTAEIVLALALVGELALVLANILARLAFNTSFLWSDEVARFALSVLAFVGGAVAYQRRQHACVRLFINMMSLRSGRIFLALADVLVLLIAALVGVVSIDFIRHGWSEMTPILQLPQGLIAIPLPVGMALLVVYAGANLVSEHRRLATPLLIGVCAVVLAADLMQDYWLDWVAADGGIAAALVLFVLAILLGVPVGFVLLLSTMFYIWASDAAPMLVLPQTMVNGTGNFILLAVPFFILAGLVMERGGISLRMVRFIQALVGHLRGGMLQVTVASMYVVSGLSGSKPADVAAVGTVMRDELRERHGAPEGAAVLAASAVMGETVPPSIAMLIVGSITNVSVGAMFIGGLLPAMIMAAFLMGLIYWRARRAGTPRLPAAPRREILARAGQAVLPMLMPGMLLGGILFGVATPTEVAALAVIYGLALATLVYRAIQLRGIMRLVVDAATLTGVLLFIFAAASAFSWTLTIAYLPQELVLLLKHAGNSQALFMIASIILLIVVGVLLEGLPSLNVLAPLLLPIAGQLGISELHYALVLIIAMGIGGFMPLAGVGFYVCCAVMRCEVEPASRAMLPYLGALLVGLLVVAFVPWFSLALPHAFGFRG